MRVRTELIGVYGHNEKKIFFTKAWKLFISNIASRIIERRILID